MWRGRILLRGFAGLLVKVQGKVVGCVERAIPLLRAKLALFSSAQWIGHCSSHQLDVMGEIGWYGGA